jgi:hypothetical protein
MRTALPLCTSSSFVVLSLDWLSFAYVTQAPQQVAMVTALASLATVLLVWTLEPSDGRDAFAPRSLRALGAGISVAIPLPLYGTIVAIVLIAWARLVPGGRSARIFRVRAK